MKRFLSLLGALLIAVPVFAASSNADPNPADTDEKFVYDNAVLAIRNVAPPYENDDLVVFTADADARSVGIVFDFEGYKTVHQFRIRKTRDQDGKVTSTVMFYILNRPKYIQSVSYRLIVDGLWTTDPCNPDSYYDENTGIQLSQFTFSSITPPATAKTDDSMIHFIYQGTSGQEIHLGGSFTNWDPWIYVMQETAPGFYELSLPLPSGTYYYNYYLGMKAVTDKTNPKKAYTADGRIASVITVN